MNVKICGSSGGLKVSVAADGCRSCVSIIDVKRCEQNSVSRIFFQRCAKELFVFGTFCKIDAENCKKKTGCVFRCFFKIHLNNCKALDTSVGFENRCKRMNMAEKEEL